MDWTELLRRTPRGQDWCGPPPRDTIRPPSSPRVKTSELCSACGTRLQVINGPGSLLAVDATWRCPLCGAQYQEAERAG